TRLPMVFFFFFRGPAALLALTLLYFMGHSFIKPVQNIFMKMNYEKREIGKIFAYSISVNKILFIISAYVFGRWLDADGSVYILVFSISGAFSFLSLFILALIPFKGWTDEKQSLQKMDLLIFPTIVKVFKKNADYFRYETAFFIYGGGFMVILPAIPIMLVDYLNLSYSVISFGRGVVSAVVIITLIPLLGKLFDRRDPVFMGVIAFAILVGHPFSMIFAYFINPELSKYVVYLSYIFFGVGMAAVTLCWNLGPMYFACNNMEIPQFTATHVTLTGIRGLIWPFSGYLLLKIHILLPFVASIIFLTAATLIMRSLHKRPKKAIHPQVEPA
ncbi:MAG: MFS transporter, partial [bacterium]